VFTPLSMSFLQFNDLGQVLIMFVIREEPEVPTYKDDCWPYFEYQMCLWDPSRGLQVISSPGEVIGRGAIDGIDRSVTGEASLSNSGHVVFQAVSPDLPGEYGIDRHNLYLWSPKKRATVDESSDIVSEISDRQNAKGCRVMIDL